MLIKRWWRSRGFGIHSPLAFRLITRVLCDEGADYYAFSTIDPLCADGVERRLAHRLYKMMVAVPISKIVMDDADVPPGIKAAVLATTLNPDGAVATLRCGNRASALMINDNTPEAGTLTIEGKHDIYILRLKNAPTTTIKIL